MAIDSCDDVYDFKDAFSKRHTQVITKILTTLTNIDSVLKNRKVINYLISDRCDPTAVIEA